MKYPLTYENEKIEFKKSLSQLNKGLEALTAMLNKNGYGKVVFGVLDNADIEGLNNIRQESIKKYPQE